MWELSGCVKPPDVHKKYPPCPSPPLIEGGPGASFTWRSSPRAKERCPPAVIVGLVSAPHTKPCCEADAYVWWLTYFLASLHMRGKEEGGRGATLSEKVSQSGRVSSKCNS